MLYSAMLALVGADDEQTSKELAHMRKALPYVHAGITQETPTHGFVFYTWLALYSLWALGSFLARALRSSLGPG